MSLGEHVNSSYLSEVKTDNIRVVEIPNTLAGFNLVSNAVAAAAAYMANYTQIVAAGTIVDPTWLVGIGLGIPVVEALQADIQIAYGAVGVEIVICTLPCGTNVFPAVEWPYPVLWLKSRYRLVGAPRLSFNIRKSTAASAAGFNGCHLILETGVGT